MEPPKPPGVLYEHDLVGNAESNGGYNGGYEGAYEEALTPEPMLAQDLGEHTAATAPSHTATVDLEKWRSTRNASGYVYVFGTFSLGENARNDEFYYVITM